MGFSRSVVFCVLIVNIAVLQIAVPVYGASIPKSEKELLKNYTNGPIVEVASLEDNSPDDETKITAQELIDLTKKSTIILGKATNIVKKSIVQAASRLSEIVANAHLEEKTEKVVGGAMKAAKQMLNTASTKLAEQQALRNQQMAPKF